MATPNPGTDGTALNAALMSHYVHAGNATTAPKMLWGVIFWSTTWQVQTSFSVNDITSGMLSWSTDHLIVTLSSGFTLAPIPIVSPTSTGSYWPKAIPISSTVFHVYFYNDAGTLQTTQATGMHFGVHVIGG